MPSQSIPDAITCLRQPRACLLEAGEFAHAPDLPWVVRDVGKPERYEELLAADVFVTSLEPYAADTWEVLASSPAFDGRAFSVLRNRLNYVDDLVALHPIAILAEGAPVDLALETRYSPAELSHLNDKMMHELAQGKVQVSRAAKDALGNGFNAVLTGEAGTPLYEMVELELSDHSILLGWAWVWHRK